MPILTTRTDIQAVIYRQPIVRIKIIIIIIKTPLWLGHKGTSIAKVTLLCVSWSIFPFEYVAPFPGIIISGRIGVDFWLPIIFPAEMFYSSLCPFMSFVKTPVFLSEGHVRGCYRSQPLLLPGHGYIQEQRWVAGLMLLT